MNAVIKHTKRYVVQWLCIDEWLDEKSFRSLWRAKRRARDRTRWMPYDYRVIDTEAVRDDH